MPTYEYQCHKCGKQFEYVQRISDAPKKKCEACGGKLERLISGGSFITEIHTHQPDGVIHVESGQDRPYTLGQLFGEWSVRLNARCVGRYCGGSQGRCDCGGDEEDARTTSGPETGA